jgi:hypothetical protein
MKMAHLVMLGGDQDQPDRDAWLSASTALSRLTTNASKPAARTSGTTASNTTL